jgi:very-short-patch-repair endonuclease
MWVDDQLRGLASKQQSLVAIRQAYELGVTESQLRHRLRRGDWERVTTRVLGLVGSPSTDLRAPMLAVLHHGAETFTSHETALAIWGIPGFSMRPAHVISGRTRDRRVGVGVVHSTTDLLETQVAVVQGVPIVTPIRAIFDIAGRVHATRVERALDNAWARRLISYALLHRTLEELADRGRPGIRLMRELADARPARYRPPESNTEARVLQILERAGERSLRRQVNLGTQANWVGRVDFVDDEVPLIVEVQSELFHGSVLDRRRDDERIAALTAAGYDVIEVWETDVWREPDKVVAAIRGGRSRAATRQVA